MTQGGGIGVGRSTAIVLFTDLVGSTELRSRVGEAVAEDLRRQHDALLAGAVEASRGNLVKNLGDGIMATFVGASDAVGAAVAIEQAIGRHNCSGAAPLEVRIGISAGDVVFEGDDCFGTPVIEAARLCATARGGQILTTDVVRWLAGSAGGHEFTPVGALELKGLPAPVPVCEVAWQPLPTADIPMPTLLTDIGRIFVSREAEVERLTQLWKEAATAGQRVALLAGEPGVGKTRLAAELAEAAHAEAATVLAGRCDEDLGVPYQPFVEALRHFLDHTSHEKLADTLGRYRGELVRLVPEMGERIPGLAPPLRSDPETERYRLFDAVAAWLAAASADAPVLLVLDDLQWAAKPTLLLLRHVVRSAEPKRLLVLGTYRDTDLGHDHPLVEVLADLRRQDGVERLSLVGLDSSGVAAYMTLSAGHELDDEDWALARAIYEETEGNPFFVREVLRHLAEIGALERRESRWGIRLPLKELGIPEGVREVVGRRLSRLSKEANRVLRGAAVLGPEFELSVLLAAEGSVNQENLLAALEEATEARLVIEAPGPTARYRFAHALVRETIYRELSAARRVTLHRQMAHAIEVVHADRLDDHLPALAHHWARASAPAAETGKAVDYATWAGDRALAQLAHDEAVVYYRQALELLQAAGKPPDDPRRLELLIALGEAQRRAGEASYRQTLLDAARLAQQRREPTALARAALANSRSAWWSAAGEVDAERVEVLEAALQAVGEEDVATRAALLATLGVELTWSGDQERRVRLSDEALRLARQHDDLATLAHVLVTRVPTLWGPGTFEERRINTAELVSVAQRLGDPVTMFKAHYVRFRFAMEAGEIEEADRHLDHAQVLSADLGQPTLRWMMGWCGAGRDLLAGNIQHADQLAQETFELGQRTGQPDAGLYFAPLHFYVLFEQGRLEEFEPFLSDLHARYPRLTAVAVLLTLLYCEAGRNEEARTIFEHLVSPSLADFDVDPTWLMNVMACAAIAAHLGDRERAAALHVVLAPYADQRSIGAGVALGPGAHYLGMLETTLKRFEEAERHFVSAARAHEDVGAPAWLARALLEWARMLLTRAEAGDEERARDLLGQALATARELGLASVERRSVQLLSSE